MSHDEIGLVEHRRTPQIPSAERIQDNVLIVVDNRCNRRAALHTEEPADLGSKLELLGAVELKHVRAIRRQASVPQESTPRVVQDGVQVEVTVGVAARTIVLGSVPLAGGGSR